LRRTQRTARRVLPTVAQFVSQSLRYKRPRQTLGDNKWIITERCKEFSQYVRLFGISCHSIHLSLKFICEDWGPSFIRHELRFGQVGLDLMFNVPLRGNRI
jgi:hypothetical protein